MVKGKAVLLDDDDHEKFKDWTLSLTRNLGSMYYLNETPRFAPALIQWRGGFAAQFTSASESIKKGLQMIDHNSFYLIPDDTGMPEGVEWEKYLERARTRAQQMMALDGKRIFIFGLIDIIDLDISARRSSTGGSSVRDGKRK